jgi:hypothetical protein
VAFTVVAAGNLLALGSRKTRLTAAMNEGFREGLVNMAVPALHYECSTRIDQFFRTRAKLARHANSHPDQPVPRLRY